MAVFDVPKALKLLTMIFLSMAYRSINNRGWYL
jgi:hypothetical protein